MTDSDEDQTPEPEPEPRQMTPRGAVISSGTGFIDSVLGEITRDGSNPNPALNTSGGYSVTQLPTGHYQVVNPFGIGLGNYENTLEANKRIARDRLAPAGQAEAIADPATPRLTAAQIFPKAPG